MTETKTCGETLDEVYTCTKQVTDMTHVAQHHDEVNDVMWRNVGEFFYMHE